LLTDPYMKETFSKDIFERYATGKCTEEEQAIVEAWYLKELQQEGQRPSAGQLMEAKEEMWNSIRPKRRIVPLLAWASAAAVLAAALLFVYQFRDSGQKQVAPLQEQTRLAVKPEQQVGEVLMASKIENSMMKLPDGSTVILEKGSKLTLLPAFNKAHNREVELEGKAFFDIAHNPARPFIIYSGPVRTTVLGTAFDVTAMPGSDAVKVNVIRGLVEVRSTKTHWMTVLSKNYQVVFDGQHQMPQRKAVNAAEELSWNRKDLEFNDISVGEAQSRLEDQFGFKISVQDAELRNATFTYSMRSTESAESFIKSICAFIGASYRINYQNKTISIQPLNH